MYTIRYAVRQACWRGLPPLLLTGISSQAKAQDLPPIQKVKIVEAVEAPPKPAPNEMLGVVRDTAGAPIPGAEVIVPDLRLRLSSNRRGEARFQGVPEGKYVVRARKLGYASQFAEFTVDETGGFAEFKLVPAASSIAPVMGPDERPGISGTVGDTASQPIAGAIVRILGAQMETETDSSGRFHLPAKRGNYTVRVTKPGYDFRLIQVSVPGDSGRHVAVWLSDATSFPTLREVRILDSLRQKAAWTKSNDILVYTHDQLARVDAEWSYDALVKVSSRFRAGAPYLQECAAVLNGGPGFSRIANLTTDEIESVEIYGLPSSPPVPDAPRRARPTSIMNGDRTNGTPSRAAGRPVIQTHYPCPIIYAWLR